jgi:hypothetical protein
MPIIAGKDPGLLWAAEQPPLPIEPSQNDFELLLPDGTVKKLFPECSQYLQEARSLIERANEIAQKVHGCKNVSLPPAD